MSNEVKIMPLGSYVILNSEKFVQSMELDDPYFDEIEEVKRRGEVLPENYKKVLDRPKWGIYTYYLGTTNTVRCRISKNDILEKTFISSYGLITILNTSLYYSVRPPFGRIHLSKLNNQFKKDTNKNSLQNISAKVDSKNLYSFVSKENMICNVDMKDRLISFECSNKTIDFHWLYPY